MSTETSSTNGLLLLALLFFCSARNSCIIGIKAEPNIKWVSNFNCIILNRAPGPKMITVIISYMAESSHILSFHLSFVIFYTNIKHSHFASSENLLSTFFHIKTHSQFGSCVCVCVCVLVHFNKNINLEQIVYRASCLWPVGFGTK